MSDTPTEDSGILEMDAVLRALPLRDVKTILEMSADRGDQAYEFFKRRGLEVSTIRSGDYGDSGNVFSPNGTWSKAHFSYEAGAIHKWEDGEPFLVDCFDAAWVSRFLERSLNTEEVLYRLWRIIKPYGYLFLQTTAYDPRVVRGNYHPGWNIGHLMHILAVAGFDVKSGSFTTADNSVIAVVKKVRRMHCSWFEDVSPTDGYNYVTIEAAGRRDFEGMFHPQLGNHVSSGFDGNLTEVNWPPKE